MERKKSTAYQQEVGNNVLWIMKELRVDNVA